MTLSTRPILELNHASASAGLGHDCALSDVNITVSPGDLYVVGVNEDSTRIPLADLALGLIAPDSGTVYFRGRDWTRLSEAEAARERSYIGRYFEDIAWISNLGVDENILLPQLHQGPHSEKVLRGLAEGLARIFGLDGLPGVRALACSRKELARAQLVRVFLGAPELIILERPELVLEPPAMSALSTQLQAVRERGGAILWVSSQPPLFRDVSMRPTQMFRLRGESLDPQPPDAPHG